MGRHRRPQIRQRLLEACTDHALEHGLPDRLGPLAAAAGTWLPSRSPSSAACSWTSTPTGDTARTDRAFQDVLTTIERA